MTEPYYQSGPATIFEGDCIEIMRTLPDASFDAVVTDPPYSLSFMGREWDSWRDGASFEAWCCEWGTECFRLLKPGGHLLAFGGSRTWHRLAAGIEDAGFEIRDSIAWLYGCLTADADVLTDRGWVNGLGVREGDLVAQWDHDTGRITLAPVERTFRAPWDGPMRVLRSSDTDQVLTPNHRVYHQTYEREQSTGARTGSWSAWKVAEAGSLSTWQATRLPIAGTHDGPGIGGEDYAALLGWVWTEGGFDQSGSGVRIYQSSVNPEKCDEIAALLDRMGPHKRYDYARTYTRRNGQTHQYTATTWFISGDIANRVREDLPGKRPTYDLLWRMTAAEKRAMLRAAMLGDGSGWGGSSPQFYQKHEDDLVWLQTLLALIDQAGKVTMRGDRQGGQLSLRQRGTTDLQARHLRNSTEHYTGEVWCVKVPSGAFLARRNGHVFITGNSGFPKSLDVAKAIDKASGQNRARKLEFTEWLRSTGITVGAINDLTSSFMGSHYLTSREQAAIPTAEMFDLLRPALPEVPEEIERLVAERTGIEWTEYAKRPLLAERPAFGIGGKSAYGGHADGATMRTTSVVEGSPAAQWEGWGTALKPSHEPVVVARKPEGMLGILARIGSNLDALEAWCKSRASGAARSSAPIPRGSRVERVDSALASAATPPEGARARATGTGAAADSSAQTDTSASEWTVERFWNTVTSWRACWAELCEATSTFTTSITTSRTTDLTILSSSLWRLTQSVTAQSTPEPVSWSSLASAVDGLFAAGVLSWRSVLALSAHETATGDTPTSFLGADGSSRQPSFEPIVVARKPLAGTVAANVLAHGTGALNIDACRLGDAARHNPSAGSNGRAAPIMTVGRETVGRWPANVVLDEATAAELDRQPGVLTSGTMRSGTVRQPRAGGTIYGADARTFVPADTYGDDVGASRFFPTFRYEAKAPASERPVVDGLQHSTVKPLALMQWLCRLVTRPGGRILEPFAGSGTTVEAALSEGFEAVGIEREADYLPLIVSRLSKPIEQTLDLGGDAA